MRRMMCLALLVMAVLAIAGCGRDEENGGGGGSDPGITDDEIKIGGSYPFSGPASAYRSIAEGAKAQFEFVNAKGAWTAGRSTSSPSTTPTSLRRRSRTRGG